MNHKNMQAVDAAFAEMLETLAQEIQPAPGFQARLETQLKAEHHKTGGSFRINKRDVLQFAGWAMALLVLGLALNWVIRSLAPAPEIAGPQTQTPEAPTPIRPQEDEATSTPSENTFNWYGTPLYLNAPLPVSPGEANVYSLQPEQPATPETAQRLAERFGIDGQVYVTPGETTEYMVTAGGPRLYVRSDNSFSYYTVYGSDFIGGRNLTDEQASAAISEFLQSHGFDFEYQIEHAPQVYGNYYAVPLLDGLPTRYDYLMPARLDFLIDDYGQVLTVHGALVNAQPVGSYGIISAEDALQKIFADLPAGVETGLRSGAILDEYVWFREYPENEPLTIYGEVQVLASAEGGPSFITIHNHTVTGAIAGLESMPEGQLAEARGRFITSNGIRTFQVEAWQPSGTQMAYLSGFLHTENGQVQLTSDDGSIYPLVDAPADVPLNTQPGSQTLLVNGILTDGQLEWMIIQYFPSAPMGGGGGGGYPGLYQLNLSGTPTLMPTPEATEPTPSPQEFLAGLPSLEGTRGILRVSLYESADGSLRPEYNLLIDQSDIYLTDYIQLEGDGLDALQGYNHRPVDVWAVPDHLNNYGAVVMKVTRFEIPYPDLKVEAIHGTESLRDINGQAFTLLTTGQGQEYVMLYENGRPMDYQHLPEGDQDMIVLGILIPDDVFGGYPAVRFVGGMPGGEISAADAQSSAAINNEPDILPELPTATIEKIELIYYTSDPRSLPPGANSGSAYIQPMWRFYGHYSNGDEFEVLIQALKDEYLSPEIQYIEAPG